jgi:hypothetical protein
MAESERPDQVLEIRKAANGETRLHPLPPVDLADGQIRLRIDSYAVTANNVSYAGAGDLLGYWDFFPADDDPTTWGRVPAMGWAEIVESRVDGLDVGSRYYGWFPMASSVVFTAAPTRDGFRDDGPHRQAHAPIYRAYLSTAVDPWYDSAPDGEDRHAVLRVLFLTGFLADEFFADCGGAPGGEDTPYFGAQQVIVLSASSKTAIGFAQRAARRDGLDVVGVTSAVNVDLVTSLGCYDRVVTYDDLDALPVVPSVVIDMAGNGAVLTAVHARLGDEVRHSMMVGKSHHDAAPTGPVSGPAPQFFFAPSDVERRVAAWGPAEYQRRTTEAVREFVDASRQWLRIEHRFGDPAGPDGAQSAWADTYAGRVTPDVGLVTSFTRR